MVKHKISKKESQQKINDFFKDIKNKSPKEIKKIKRLAMHYHIRLGQLRKTFCKKCLTPYSGNEKVRIKDNIRIIVCRNCEYVSRWIVKPS